MNDLIVQIGRINTTAKHGWELLDLDNLEFANPAVICLSGNGAITNKQANRLAKQVQGYLDLLFKTKAGNATLENVDIIGVKYALSDVTGVGSITKPALDLLVNAILALLVDANNNKLNLQTAKKNISRLTFFTYCAGNHELQNIVENLNEKMAEVGYNQNEIKEINHAMLEISFAPLAYPVNLIPSVRIMSLKDSFMAKYLCGGFGAVSYEQINNLDGIYLHQEEAGPLFGIFRDIENARSIEVISTNLLNSCSEEIDEHAITLLARDPNWNVQTTKIDGIAHQSFNADCVSQIMAWVLCKGVENSIQNFQADKYVPNTYWDELMDDFKSLIKHYHHEKLAQNPTLMHKKRKSNFNRMRAKKLFRFLPRFSIPTYEQMVDTLNNADSLETAIAYLQKNNFFGVEHVLPEVQVLTQSEKNDILRMAGKTETSIPRNFDIEV